MSQVFITYRQTDDAQMQRVRDFGERLRSCGIEVLLDQLFLDDHPAGPDEGWDKWSSDRALKTDYVLIVGTQAWFDCFEKTQPPGTGLGAACEADDIRSRIYKAAGLNKTVRVIVFDEAEATNIPAKLDRYHRFNALRDFANVVRWLGGTVPIDTVDTPRTPIPHNLPSLQPFFGREDELRRIADALDPESRIWGALIDGPGGMGKTSLAVLAAYDAPPEDFDKIAFVSLKPRELDDDGLRDLSPFLISGLAELLNELARELGHDEITKALEDQRPRLLLDALRGTRTLLVLDNLESLVKSERDIVFTFVKKLPPGCKAILTARGRIGSAAEELILEKFSEEAALATLAKLAETNATIERTSDIDRMLLYRETGGNPLLLRWTVGQLGRGSCVTIFDAIAYLRSCPEGNDPLEFVFGDLVDDFNEAETRVLCALTYFILPAKVEHVVELAKYAEADIDRALRSLINRSLVVPSEELRTFALVPLVADFLHKKRPEVLAETGDRLEKYVYALVIEKGYDKHDRLAVLDAAWPTVAAALPRFLVADNKQLQTMSNSIGEFLNFTGRLDEWLALVSDAENVAVAAKDFLHAGWRANDAAFVHHLRGQATKVFDCADRAEGHWSQVSAGTRERAAVIRLRGIGHELSKDFTAAIYAYKETVELMRTLGDETKDVAVALISLAGAEKLLGDFDGAEHDFREAQRIYEIVGDHEGVAIVIGNLASVSLDRKDWAGAEVLARQALSLAERIGRQELIASNYHRIAKALVRQDKKAEARPYAIPAIEIFSRLGLPDVVYARKTLAECES